MAAHVCPFWIGYLLASPLRKLAQNPRRILEPYVQTGMTALDIGCAMGFFSLPLARLVGPKGRVICVDLQKRMISALERRARRAGVADRIETRLCSQDSLGLDDLHEQIDFALAFAVVHEVPDVSELFVELHRTLKPSARLLVAEPKLHVTEEDFGASISVARQNGFAFVEGPRIGRSRAVLLSRAE